MKNLSNLTRLSGLASMLGGVLFAIGIAIHPLRHGQAVNESPYSAIHVLIAVGLMLVLFGLVGLYARQLEQLGKPGLCGFILAFIGNVWTYGLIITEGFMWPAVGLYDPAAVHNFGPNGVGAWGSSLLLIFFVGLAFFAVGYTLFGLVTMRAGVLPRWGRIATRDRCITLRRRRFFVAGFWSGVGHGDDHRNDRRLTLQPGLHLVGPRPVDRRRPVG